MRRIEIFRAGSHTDIHGNTHTLTEADLSASARAYDPARHEAPLVIGHPKLDAPAWGWVKSLQAAGASLAALPEQVQPAFAEQVAAGSYKKVSASFYPPDAARNPVPGVWYLRHVGFLGAMPPAVKGLRPVEFGEDDDQAVTLEFAETDLSHPPSKEASVSPEEAAALKAQNEGLQRELQALNQRVAQQAAAQRHGEHVAYAEGLAEQARIPAAAVALVAQLRDLTRPAEGDAPAFGEGDERQPLDKALCAFLDGLSPRVEFGEAATRERAAGTEGAGDEEAVAYAEGSDPERIALDKKIRAYAKTHQTDYATAARAVASAK